MAAWWSIAGPPEGVAKFVADAGYAARRAAPWSASATLLDHLPYQAHDSCQTVCRRSSAGERDSHGRALPVWQGCSVVAEDDVFLINAQYRTSLDRRRFGPYPSPPLSAARGQFGSSGRIVRAAFSYTPRASHSTRTDASCIAAHMQQSSEVTPRSARHRSLGESESACCHHACDRSRNRVVTIVGHGVIGACGAVRANRVARRKLQGPIHPIDQF